MKFEEILIDNDCKSVLMDAANRYGSGIDKGDLKSLMLEAMWVTSKDYNAEHPSKIKLTTFLVNIFKWKIFNLLRSRRKEKEKSLNGAHIKDISSNSHAFIFDLLESLDPAEKYLCEERFINKRTVKSIAEEYGVSVQTIISRCNKLKTKIKKMCLE